MIRSSALLLSPLLLFSVLLGGSLRADEIAVGGALKGRVQLSGSIVDTGCVMSVGNEGQTVVFQPAALHGLIHGDASFQRPLNILLSGCGGELDGQGQTSSLRALKLTFEGDSSGRYFDIQGVAQGVALQIKDSRGKLITPGMSLDGATRAVDAIELNYFLELVGTGSSLQAGNYHATIKLSIQHF
jgi:type 1 fimbria pilin